MRALAYLVAIVAILALVGLQTYLVLRPTLTAEVSSPSAGTAPLTAATKTPEERVISVVADGTAKAQPDVAYINVGVQTSGQTAKAAIDANNRQMMTLLTKLKAAGLADSQIRTMGVNVFFGPQGPPPSPSDYRANNNVEITITDVSKASEILSLALSEGATNVSGARLGLRDDTALRQQALLSAVKAARPKAEAVAQAMGVKLKDVVSVSEQSFGMPPPGLVGFGGKGGDGAVPFESSELTIVVRATVNFTFEP